MHFIYIISLYCDVDMQWKYFGNIKCAKFLPASMFFHRMPIWILLMEHLQWNLEKAIMYNFVDYFYFKWFFVYIMPHNSIFYNFHWTLNKSWTWFSYIANFGIMALHKRLIDTENIYFSSGKLFAFQELQF